MNHFKTLSFTKNSYKLFKALQFRDGKKIREYQEHLIFGKYRVEWSFKWKYSRIGRITVEKLDWINELLSPAKAAKVSWDNGRALPSNSKKLSEQKSCCTPGPETGILDEIYTTRNKKIFKLQHIPLWRSESCSILAVSILQAHLQGYRASISK